MFFNARHQPAHDSQNTEFFKPKPTRRKVSASQYGIGDYNYCDAPGIVDLKSTISEVCLQVIGESR